MILDFNSPASAIRPESVGGKFYNLYQLNQIPGIVVPPAFCLTAPVVDADDISRRIAAAGSWAVRSSATLEDMPGYSAAGIFDSYLELDSLDAVMVAIEKCFAAVHSERVRAYMETHNLPQDQLKLCAIVQQMIPAEKAGVLFTVNPVSGADEFFGEMVDGIGESLVSGLATPEPFTIAKGEMPKDPLQQSLAKAATAIEDHYQHAQDIEWAWYNRQLYTLQSRPITVRAQQQFPAHQVWTRANIGEIIPRPLTPLSWDIFQEVVLKAYRYKFYSLTDRFFTNVAFFTPRKPPEVLSPKMFSGVLYLNLATILKSFGVEPYVDEKILELGLGFRMPERAIREETPAAERFVTKVKTKLYHLEMKNEALSMETRIEDFIKNYLALAAKRSYQSELEKLFHLNRFLFGWHITITARSFSHLGYLMHLAEQDKSIELGTSEITEWLSSQQLDPYFEEINRLRKAAHQQHNNATAADEFQQNYREFLEKFGHRSENEFELAQPAWREDAGTLEKMLHSPATDSLASRADRKMPPQIEKVLQRLSRAIRHREALKSTLIRHYREIRYHFLAVGERLAADGKIDDREDVFYLNLNEIEQETAGNHWPELIQQRKADHQAALQQNLPYLFYGDELSDDLDAAAGGGNLMQGIGCSTGTIKKRAVVLQSFDGDVAVTRDDIIVAAAADPGWTPLLLNAGGMITEIGGILSHIATIARESKIPFIVGVENATRKIKTGDIITIDGSRGTVRLQKDGDDEG